jgi:metal-sulfur cluster biosynthetic enzyme
MSETSPMSLVIENALYEVQDPEIGLNVVDLGLIRGVRHDAATGTAEVEMTLTTRTCPAGEAIVEGVRRRIERIPGVARAVVRTSFDPPWTPDAISPAGREMLGWG